MGKVNPDKGNDKDFGIKQIPFRIHYHDKGVLDKLLRDDGLTFQRFVEFCTKAYMEADPSMMRLLRDRIELHKVPREVLDRYTISQRERQIILDQIERKQDKDEILPTK